MITKADGLDSDGMLILRKDLLREVETEEVVSVGKFYE